MGPFVPSYFVPCTLYSPRTVHSPARPLRALHSAIVNLHCRRVPLALPVPRCAGTYRNSQPAVADRTVGQRRMAAGSQKNVLAQKTLLKLSELVDVDFLKPVFAKIPIGLNNHSPFPILV
jgi:hypothetical protein